MSSPSISPDLAVKLLSDLHSIFYSLHSLESIGKKIKADLRGRGVDKISQTIVSVVKGAVTKKEEIVQNYMKISGVANLAYLYNSTVAEEK